jgi:hypothetical protein
MMLAVCSARALAAPAMPSEPSGGGEGGGDVSVNSCCREATSVMGCMVRMSFHLVMKSNADAVAMQATTKCHRRMGALRRLVGPRGDVFTTVVRSQFFFSEEETLRSQSQSLFVGGRCRREGRRGSTTPSHEPRWW